MVGSTRADAQSPLTVAAVRRGPAMPPTTTQVGSMQTPAISPTTLWPMRQTTAVTLTTKWVVHGVIRPIQISCGSIAISYSAVSDFPRKCETEELPQNCYIEVVVEYSKYIVHAMTTLSMKLYIKVGMLIKYDSM